MPPRRPRAEKTAAAGVSTLESPMGVELWPVSKIEGYAKNAKKHPPAQVAQIAASMLEFGWTLPCLVRDTGVLGAGHGRILAAQSIWADGGTIRSLSGAEIPAGYAPVIVARGWSEAQFRAYVIADNKLTENGEWDQDLLRLELGELDLAGFDLGLTGFGTKELEGLFAVEGDERGDPDALPAPQAAEVSRLGDIWILGAHRVMCGDSTSAEAVAALMAGEIAHLLHADPPYGMGKEKDGVVNDNIYGEALDRFQMAWWEAFRPFLASNASAYIWGNAPDLWRLWYMGGLGQSEKFELRNEIVWDKKSIAGMASPDLTQYPEASERCLFFQFGNQFLGNINSGDFPESWEPVRNYMASEADAVSLRAADVQRVCGCGMFSHWFTRSQFTLIPERHYATLAAAYAGHFQRPWADLKAEWDRVRGAGRAVINGKLAGVRSYFDNAHDVMHDVWDFPRVTGDDRHGHATPKPVAMLERVINSSLQPEGIVAEPFGGSGSTLIGAERTGRACYTMELQPVYVDVIVRRWQQFTGSIAVLEGDGSSFDDVAAIRVGSTV